MLTEFRIKLFIFFSLFSIFIVILSSYYGILNPYLFQSMYAGSNYFLILYKKNDSNIQNNETKCNPFQDNFKQFSVDLNGQRYPRSITLSRNKSINFKCLNRNKKIKRILFWNKFFGRDDYYFGIGGVEPFIKNRCPVTNCETTNDKSKLNESDFVITHMRDGINDLPKYRFENQRWIFLLMESPVHSPDFSIYKNFYNLTLTYRIDSNFPGAYEAGKGFYWSLNETFNAEFDYYADKNNFAAAVISNCGAGNRRLDYIKSLQNLIPVDIFGKCGKECPMHFKNGKLSGDCKEVIGKEYKFYFAFENSFCADYITEKFFNILRFNIIPVVLGAGKYDHYIPKTGFINALDYKSANELANYLKYLDSNKTAYNSYFTWKRYVRFDSLENPIQPLCDLCIRLQLEEYLGVEKSVINDINAYWGRDSNCKNPNYI